MAIMQSQQCQCCLCVVSIFSVLFGVIMTSTGVCLVLNYGIMEVDTRGLPPEWQNEEGKKIVGIILICCGIVAMGIGAAVSTLFYTVCSRAKPSSPPSSTPGQGQGARSEGGAIPKTSGQHTPARGSRAHGKRKVSKPPRYHSRLPPHPEAAELDGSRTSAQLSAALAASKSNNAAPSHATSSSHPPIIQVNSGPALDCVMTDRSKEKEVRVTTTSNSSGEPSLISYTTTLQQAEPPAHPRQNGSVREYRPNPVLKRIDEDSGNARGTPMLLDESEGCATPPPELAERDKLMGQDNAAFEEMCESVESDEDISEMALPSLSPNQSDAKTLDNDVSNILK